MKLQQETASLGQIATVMAKPTISDTHLKTPTRDVLKFGQATWDPPWQGLLLFYQLLPTTSVGN